jgi:hypothetical protein
VSTVFYFSYSHIYYKLSVGYCQMGHRVAGKAAVGDCKAMCYNTYCNICDLLRLSYNGLHRIDSASALKFTD